MEQTEDKEMELAKEIVMHKVDKEIAKQLEDQSKVDAINDLIKEKEKELNHLEDVEPILEDMEDEMYADIMAN